MRFFSHLQMPDVGTVFKKKLSFKDDDDNNDDDDNDNDNNNDDDDAKVPAALPSAKEQ